MKKRFLPLIMIMVTISAYSQRIDEYTASNGITYHEGDTIQLNRGSSPEGRFIYLQMAGWLVQGGGNFLGHEHAGLAVTVKKITKKSMKGAEKVIFTVGAGNITNYQLFIEDAIATCEIEDCNNPEVTETKEGGLDKLKKLKELLDMGAITQEEYENQKTKILESL